MSQNWNELISTTGTGSGSSTASYGYSVSIDGDYAIVGAYQETSNSQNEEIISGAGAAYILKKNAMGNWEEIKKIVASDRALGDQFGRSVAINGNYAIVGADREDEDAAGNNSAYGAGAAYIFKQGEGGIDNWGQIKKITAADREEEDYFGSSVAISGNYVIVGAIGEDDDSDDDDGDYGAAYIFKQEQGGIDNWGEIKKVVADNREEEDYFGSSVSISGNYAIVGANDASSAYIYKEAEGGTDNWGQIKKITASDRLGGEDFGISVAISGNYAIVGAPKEDEDAGGVNTENEAGAAYIFKQAEGGTDNWGQIKKITASDRATNDQFGYSVAISGNYVIVGTHNEDEDAGGINTENEAGAAYIFRQAEGGTDNWGQVKKIVASDRAAADQFGISVAISGNYAITGAFGQDDDEGGNNRVRDAGAAYIFKQTEGGTDNWGQVKKIVATDRNKGRTQYGWTVAIDGDYAIIGANFETSDGQNEPNFDNAGAVYILKKNASGNWEQIKKIAAVDRAEGDIFGNSVAISGNYAIVGASAEDEDAAGNNTFGNAGAAYIFKQEQGGIDNWGQVKKIVAADRAEGDGFGSSVAISGNYAIVGALLEDEDEVGNNGLGNAGSAYIFKQEQGGTDNWGQVKKIVAADRGNSDLFGHSVAISGHYAIIGAFGEDHDAEGSNKAISTGAAYIFKQEQGGADNWGQVKKIVASDRTDFANFGYSVAINGNYILVGAFNDDEDVISNNSVRNAGSAYIFKQEQGGTDNWGQVKKIVASDRAFGDQFGRSVAISETLAIVGAYFEDEDKMGNNALSGAGSAYIFKQEQGGTDNWGQVQKIVASDRKPDNLFGNTVSISGETIIVGAHNANLSGKAYIFAPDFTEPSTISFARKLPTDEITKADELTFLVTFSEGVQNVDQGDFSALRTTATITVTPITTSTYEVKLSSGDLASLTDTVNLSFAVTPSIIDLVGNILSNTEPATNEAYIVDNTAPTVSMLTPVSDTVSIARFSNLRLTFEETVQEGTGNISIHLASDNSIIETIDITSGLVNISGNQVSINPTNDFIVNTAYYILVPNTAIIDLATNAYSGIASTTGWQFTTIARGAGCSDDLVETGVINTGNYQANFSITTDGQIANSSNITFKAGETITLSPNFHAVAGSDFHASIEPCTLPSNLVESAPVFHKLAITEPSNQLVKELALRVYPNPTPSSSTIEFFLPETEIVQLRLFDITGKVLQSWYDGQQLAAGNHQLEVSGQGLSEGIYFIQLQTRNKNITQKWGLIR